MEAMNRDDAADRAIASMKRQAGTAQETVVEVLGRVYDELDGIYGGEGVTEKGADLLERAMALIDTAREDAENQ